MRVKRSTTLCERMAAYRSSVVLQSLNLLIPFVVTSAMVASSVIGNAQSSGQDYGKRIEYKVAKSIRTVAGPETIIVHISVKPKVFNREDMLRLAEELRSDFVGEKRIMVWLFDSSSSAKTFTPLTHSLTYKRDYQSLRGFYDLDRETGREGIEFSTARGKPRDEVQLQIRTARTGAKS